MNLVLTTLASDKSCTCADCLWRKVDPHLWVNCLGQVCAILAQPAALHNLVAEVQKVQSLINTVRVEGVAPELLQVVTTHMMI